MPFIESGTCITGANRHDWLAMRNDPQRLFLGSSQFATALGMSQYSTPSQLYLEMIGELPKVKEDWRMRRGHFLQPFLLREYELMTQDAVIQEEIYYNGPVLHGIQLGTTIDAITWSRYILECKSHGWRMRDVYGDESEGEDGIPLAFYLQMMGQFEFSEIKQGKLLTAIDGEDPKVFDVKHSSEDVDNLLADLDRFCWHVSTRTPPPLTMPDEAGLMHKLYKWEGTDVIDFDATVGLKVEELERLTDAKKPLSAQVTAIEKQQKILRGEIQDAMKGTTLGRWGDIHIRVATIHKKAMDPIDYNQVYMSREDPSKPKKTAKPKKGKS